ncbi:Phage minor structural protein GP20 [Enterococcus malodoratus]|uniref:phage scaffolding protein n=1 Tax=Enterococcus malodoratus TaxID=71451 RepID=UPI0008D285D4|nr:phage scaffolding protein [Enterococcus malodoratus]SET33043.1 Phage minor structural protein GP20 [Enterococcus malodoratus]
MNKEDLIALGIEDDVAKSVMALHGKTVTNLNAKVATAESERDNAKQELATNQTELNALKESAQGNDELTQKLADLQTKFDEAKTNSEKQLSEQQKDFAIKLALNEAQALDNDIVLGQLDKETIKVVDGKLQGFEEQLNGLKENKAFLFQNSDPTPDPEPSPKPQIVPGGNPSGSQSGGKTIVQKIQERLGE